MKTIDDNSWIKLYRKMVTWRWFTDVNTTHFFLYCLFTANWEDKDWKTLKIPKGSFVSSLKKMSADSGLSEKSIRTAKKKLIETGEIEEKTTKGAKGYTVITICNYDKYQQVPIQEGQIKGKLRANNGQIKGNLVAITKEDKEYKEEKEINNNNIYNPLVFPPSLDDIAAFCRMRNNYIVPERFLKWYTDNGWTDNKKKPISDWRNAIYNWEKRDRADGKIPPPPGVRLGLGEFMKTDGTRSYGDGRVSVPLDAPPRPSPSYFWLASSNCWMID